MRKKLDWEAVLLYVVLIPFFYPRGFAQYYPLYKKFFTLWLYVAAALILCLCVRALIRGEVHVDLLLIATAGYFVIQLAITLFVQKGITEGLQRLFMAPMLCGLCTLYLRGEKRGHFLKCLADILFIGMVLNVTVFSPWLWKDLFAVDGHILFLGHVQMISQMGMLELLLCYILHKTGRVDKWYAIAMVVVTVITMLVSDTAASKIVLIALVLAVLYTKIFPHHSLLRLPSQNYVYAWIALNAVIIVVLQILNGNYKLFGVDLSLHGRMPVWDEVLKLLSGHWLFGYGVYGVKITMFWHEWIEAAGMNYAHNEFFQRLMDGGIVLLAAFTMLMIVCTRPVNRMRNREAKCVVNMLFTAFLLIMLIESCTEYYYFWVFLMLLEHLPRFLRKTKKKEAFD